MKWVQTFGYVQQTKAVLQNIGQFLTVDASLKNVVGIFIFGAEQFYGL